MNNSRHQCCTPGCGTLVPAELELEGFCVPHFLLSAEKACSEMRREAATGESDAARRAELESYVAASAMKLALIGTGSVRLSDEMKETNSDYVPYVDDSPGESGPAPEPFLAPITG